MKHITLTLCFLLICFSHWAKADESVITFTIAKPAQAYPPYHWQGESKTEGLIPEIIEAMLKRSENLKVKYINVPWKRMFELARAGEVDAIMPINRNTEREAYLSFVAEPLINERMNFISSNAFNIEFDGDINKLAQHQVAGIAGYYYGEAYNAANFETIELPNEETQVRMLTAGRFPLALMDANVLPHYLNKAGEAPEYEIKVLQPPLYEAGLHLAFSQNSKHAYLTETLVEHLLNLKQSPEYQAILARHLSSPTMK